MIGVDVQIANNQMTEAAAETLKRNIKFYCNTPRGSLPQNRRYGIDATITDLPYDEMRMRLTVDLVTGIRDTFGVHLNNINVTADANGEVNVLIKI